MNRIRTLADTVISASRRTDIPALYTPWLMKGIQQGEVLVVNPFNRVPRKVDLRPEAVHSMVFWSKNFAPFLTAKAHTRLKEMGYRLFFNFTINGENSVLEPNIPALDQRMSQAEALCRHFGPDTINWRFDPISFYQDNGVPRNCLEDFETIARRLANLGISRCITSFYDPYKKVDQRLRRLAQAGGPHIRFTDPGADVRQRVIQRMAALLDTLGIRLFLCCESALFDAFPPIENVYASACIDGKHLKRLFGGNPVTAKDTGQRRDKGCQCTRSVDIGSYDLHPCHHNCLFCYARTGMDTPNENKRP
jgi:DNA repair photolyase